MKPVARDGVGGTERIKKALALDSFYEAFNLNSLQPGSVIVVTTQSGMTIQIHKPKEEK